MTIPLFVLTIIVLRIKFIKIVIKIYSIFFISGGGFLFTVQLAYLIFNSNQFTWWHLILYCIYSLVGIIMLYFLKSSIIVEKNDVYKNIE
jgi:hypothetical protein